MRKLIALLLAVLLMVPVFPDDRWLSNLDVGGDPFAGARGYSGGGVTIVGSTGNVSIGGDLVVDGSLSLDDLTVLGALAVNGAALTSDDATFALLNVTPTTINFGGAAAINISGSGLMTTILGSLTVDENIIGFGPSHTFGLTDTIAAIVRIRGHATSSNTGGQILIDTAADFDTTINHYIMQAFQDDFFFGPSNNEDALKFNGATGAWEFTVTTPTLFAGDIAANGGDITSTGALAISSGGGGNLTFTAASQFSIFAVSNSQITSNANITIDIDTDANQGSRTFSVTHDNGAGLLFNVSETGLVSVPGTFTVDGTVIFNSSFTLATDFGVGTSTPGIDIAGGTTDYPANDTLIHIKDSSENAVLVIEGETSAIADWIDLGGGTNDKIFRIDVDGGLVTFSSLNDDLTANSSMMNFDLGTGVIDFDVSTITGPSGTLNLFETTTSVINFGGNASVLIGKSGLFSIVRGPLLLNELTRHGDASNNLYVQADGFTTLNGTGRAVMELSHGAVDLLGPGPGSPPTGPNLTGHAFTLDFDATVDKEVFMTMEMPHNWAVGTTIKVNFHWAPIDNGAGTVTWGVETKILTPGSDLLTEASIATQIITDDTQTTQDEFLVSDMITIDTSGVSAGDFLSLRIFRDADASEGGADDDYASDAQLVAFHIEYIVDGFGSDEAW